MSKKAKRVAPGLWIIRLNNGDPTTTAGAVNDKNRMPRHGIVHRNGAGILLAGNADP